MAGFFRELWASKTLEELIRALAKRQYVVNTITDYTPFTIGAQASGYNGPMLSGLTVRTLPASGSDDPSRDAISFSFNQKKGVVFTLSDIDVSQSDVDQLGELTRQAAEKLLEDYDAFILKTMHAGLSTDAGFKNTIADTVNNKLTYADFINAMTVLDKQKAPRAGRTCVIHPDLNADLFSIPEFISRDKIATADAVKEGVIGRVLGFDVLVNADAPLVKKDWTTDPTAALPAAYFYASPAFGFGRQKEFGTKSEESALTPGDIVNIYSVYGGTVQMDNYMVAYRKDK